MAENAIEVFLKIQTVLDGLKNIRRSSSVLGREENENSAEHSWHAAMWFISLSNYFSGVDILKIVVMLLIHDVHEIFAGDFPVYNQPENYTEEERKAAHKIFGMFPESIREWLYGLWLEFNKCETMEAKIAMSFDKMQPILQSIITEGKIWKEKGRTVEQIESNKRSYMEHDRFILSLYECLLERAKEVLLRTQKEG